MMVFNKEENNKWNDIFVFIYQLIILNLKSQKIRNDGYYLNIFYFHILFLYIIIILSFYLVYLNILKIHFLNSICVLKTNYFNISHYIQLIYKYVIFIYLSSIYF